MAWGVHDVLADRLVSGVAVGPVEAEPPATIAWHTGSHPIPDHRSEAAGRAIVAYLESTDVDFVLFLISGGGSGHEPMHGGFVGMGMLDAACPGAVFTSPVPDQMLAATKAVDGGAGVLHIVKNYTGDVMNFEMAAELCRSDTFCQLLPLRFSISW